MTLASTAAPASADRPYPMPFAARKGGADQQLKFEIVKSDDPSLLPGLAIFKEGGVPQMQPSHAYPEWLWTLTKTVPLYSELLYKATNQGLESMST